MQQALIHHTIKLHPALPDALRLRLSGRQVSKKIPRSARSRMRQPEDITVSEAAARYRRVTAVDAKPGAWRNDLVPHAAEAMDIFQQPWVKEVWLCWPERTAKTNVMLNCVAAVTRGIRDLTPGNIFWLEPAEDDGGSNVKTKIIPMFRESPKLKKYLSTRADDTGKKLISFAHGMHLFPASANSARTMANYFGKYCFGNEVDKYPLIVGTETDPIKLIRKRGRDVRNSKYMFGSTPAGRFIYKGTMNCRQVLKRMSRCPHCEELILMDDDHLVIPTDATPEQVENGEVTVGYSCNACGAIWDEADRDKAYHGGKFVAVKGADVKKPLTVGLHASALPFPMIPLAEYCGKYLRSKNGDRADKIDYSHGYKVEDFTEEATGATSEETILKFRDEDLPRNVVPADTARLCITVDTQQSSFYYTIWSYGYAPQIKMHMVAHGIVEQFEDMEGLLQSEAYKNHDAVVYRINNGLIDSGGTRREYQKHSRTVEVYEFCSRVRALLPFKGMHGRTGDLVTYKDVATFPGTNKKIPGGLKRANIRVDMFKDDLERRLAAEPDDPQAVSFHADIDSAFAKHFTAETKDEHGDWKHTKRSQRIDYWDCAVAACALREMMKLRIPKKPETKSEQKPAPVKCSGGFVKGWQR